jgi:glyoxylase-like metal-dependent hydrolase (beta-lactamase superfamily II)
MDIRVEDGNIKITRLTLGPWQTNTYLIVCAKSGESMVVDAPAEATTVIGALKGTKPALIVLTHNHLDHIGAMTELRQKLKVPLACHPADAGQLGSPPEKPLKHSDTLTIGNLQVKALHTPGHTQGSTCYLIGTHLISGDTLFPGGPGHTRSSGDFTQIVRSLKEKVFTLPDETQVYPGHGEPTTLKKEKDAFSAFSARSHSPDLHGDVLWASS